VDHAEVVSANEPGDGVAVILEGLGIRQGQPRKPLVEMPHGQTGPFNGLVYILKKKGLIALIPEGKGKRGGIYSKT
jgi:hypothetical protein